MRANQADREAFKIEVAPGLARQLPGHLEPEYHPSKMFSYFGDSERFVLVAGPESEHSGWALVYGLAEREGRRLVLVLPIEQAFATTQRVPWLVDESRPKIWLHRDGTLQDAPAPERSRPDTIAAVRAHAVKMSEGAGPAEELRAAPLATFILRSARSIDPVLLSLPPSIAPRVPQAVACATR